MKGRQAMIGGDDIRGWPKLEFEWRGYTRKGKARRLVVGRWSLRNQDVNSVK